MVELKTATTNDKPQSKQGNLQLQLDLLSDAFRAYGNDRGMQFGYANGSWHVYSGGFWRVAGKIDTEDMERILNNLCPTVGLVYPKHKNVVDTHLRVDMSFRLVPDDFDTMPFIAVRNGTVDLDGPDLLDHSSDHLTTRFIDIDFDPEAECPEWEKMLDAVFENYPMATRLKIIGFIQEWMGFALVGGADARTPRALRRALFLYGPPNAGKSTVFNVIRQLLGTDRIVSMTPNAVSDKFGLQSFLTAAAWITEEVDSLRRGLDTSRIKCLITGEPITGQRKNATDAVIRFNGPVGWAGNTVPNFLESSGAIYDRIVTVPVERVFTAAEAKKKFGNMTPVDWLYAKGEMPGIFNWALQGYYRLLERGMYEKIPELQSASEAVREVNDPVFAFVRDCCDPAPNVRNTAMPLAVAALAYVKTMSTDRWQKTHALKIAIRGTVPDVYPDVKIEDNKRTDNGRGTVYVGLALNEAGLAYLRQSCDENPVWNKLRFNEPGLFAPDEKP